MMGGGALSQPGPRMFWDWFTKTRASSNGRNMNEEIHGMAQAIDQYYDSLMYEGMPIELAVMIENQRDAAHAGLTRRAITAALDGYWR